MKFFQDDWGLHLMLVALGFILALVVLSPVESYNEPKCRYGYLYGSHGRQILNEQGGGIPCKKQT